MALVAVCGSSTSTVNRLIVPSFTRFETLLLTAASERPTFDAMSTNASRESWRRICSICSSILSNAATSARAPLLLGGDCPPEDVHGLFYLWFGDDERGEHPDYRAP